MEPEPTPAMKHMKLSVAPSWICGGSHLYMPWGHL